MQRVAATAKALELIEQLKQQHGDIIFHQSGGCCDGSAPMLFPRSEFPLGGNDVCLGKIGGIEFHMSKSQFEYWEHTHLTIDAIAGNGGMFSLERPTGYRFIVRSRLYSDQELASLVDVKPSDAML